MSTRLTLSCPGGLAGKTIRVAGLEDTLTSVLVRVYHLDGAEEAHLIHPTAPFVTIRGTAGWAERARSYLQLGVEHILLGADHLLFVLGLLLIVRDRWALVKSISAFTVAHSLTLAVATLGRVSLPGPPLNAAIALSILFLGPEIVRSWRGQTSLTTRQPWLVAFAFGLLHGFGFASGLTATGLPRGEVPLALLLFNVGVEIGQLGFVFLALLLERSFRQLEAHWPGWVAHAPGYLVGSLGAFWMIQRMAANFNWASRTVSVVRRKKEGDAARRCTSSESAASVSVSSLLRSSANGWRTLPPWSARKLITQLRTMECASSLFICSSRETAGPRKWLTRACPLRSRIASVVVIMASCSASSIASSSLTSVIGLEASSRSVRPSISPTSSMPRLASCCFSAAMAFDHTKATAIS